MDGDNPDYAPAACGERATPDYDELHAHRDPRAAVAVLERPGSEAVITR